MSRLTTNIFIIPIEQGRYIVYAPVHQTAFVTNEQTVEILAKLQNGIFDPDLDSDGSLLEFLQQFDLIHLGAEDEDKRAGAYPNFRQPISLALVLEASSEDECSCCKPSAMRANMLMNLATAKQSIDLAIKEAHQRSISSFQIIYHIGKLAQISQDLINASLDYAKTKALDSKLHVRAVIWTGDQLTHEQIDWIARNLDKAVIRFDRVPDVQGGSDILDISKTYNPLLNILHALTSAGLPHAVRLTVNLGQIPGMVDAVSQICQNVEMANLYIEPTYPLQAWQGHPSQETIDFIAAFRKTQQTAAVYKGHLTFWGTQLHGKMIYSRYCSAPENSIIALPSGNILTADRRFPEKNEEYLFIATELMKDWLLAKIASSGGLVWQAKKDRKIDPGSIGDDEYYPDYIQDTLPQFTLNRRSVKGEHPTSGIFPVVAMPWEWRLSRRGFLGACLSTAMTLLLETQRVAALAATAMPFEKNTAVVTGAILQAVAATWVDPKRLSMTAIEVGENDTISAGYHLRWFALQPIDTFFTENVNFEDVKRFLFATDPYNPENKPYHFNTPDWAYFIYRRQHYPHFDHQFEMTDKLIEQLLDTGEVLLDGVRISFQAGEEEYTVVVKFQRQRDSRKRVVHFLLLESKVNSPGRPLPIHLAGHADDDPEPIRQVELDWNQASGGEWQTEARFDQGHYDEFRLIGKDVVPFTASFSYMDEDTKLAQDSANPIDGEWVPIGRVPFITQFSTWETAKSAFFPRPPKNRYLDFSGDNISNNEDWKLDFKYRPLFTDLQRAFVRILYARNQNKEFLIESGGSSLTEIRYDPSFFFQLWSLDPIIATLHSQYYWDAQDSDNPPIPGTAYDYMVTTAWQTPAQRLCYISQKVSQQTTPPVGSFKDLSGTQLEGVSRSGGELLYRAGLHWRIDPHDTQAYGQYEPPLADVRRGESSDQMSMITHFVDPKATKEEERVVDSPIHVPQSVPYPTNAQERANFTSHQLDALDLMKALQTRDGDAVITAAQVAAYKEMLQTPIDEFFAAPDPEQWFNEWLPVGPTGSRTLYYQVRPIDLFGRVGKWLEPVEVTLQANLPTPEAVAVRAIRKESGDLVVAWRLGSCQLRSGTPVNHFNLLWKHYDPQDIGIGRQFALWQNQRIQSEVLYRPPTTLKVTDVKPFNGSSISGQIISVTASTTETVIAEETALFGSNKRVVTVTTDRYFGGVLPFIDASGRYSDISPQSSENGKLLDNLGLMINGHEYDVIGLQAGDMLRVSICVVPGDRDPVDFFWSSLGANKTFTLTFKSVKESLEFYQYLRLDSFPEIKGDPELKNLSVAALAQRLTKRSTLQMQVFFPFTIEITGRESWFTGAIFEYGNTYLELKNHPGRVPILNFDTIEISSDALRFGKVWINSENPPIQKLTIRNRGLADFLVRKVTSDTTAFAVQFPESGWVTIRGRSELSMNVTFTPTVLGDVTDQLSIYGEGSDPLRIPLSGTGLNTEENEEADTQPTMVRSFLSELTLGQVIREAEPNSPQQNPTPVFSEILLQDALANSVDLYCRISLPPTYKVVSSHTATDGANDMEQLLDSRGGDFTYYDKVSNQEIVCEVLTRPNAGSTSNQSLSFLVRQAQFFPAPLLEPKRDQEWTFYPTYRVEIPCKELPDELKPGDTNKLINVAVSTHQHPAADGYDSAQEQKNLVSAPVQVRIPGEPPAPPTVAAPILITPWVDPFKTAYSSLPKLLDNRKVVQYKLRLDDPDLMNGQIPTLPTNGAFEILRAPEDALRLQILAYLRLPLPVEPQNDVGYQELLKLTDDPDLQTKLLDQSPDIRYRVGFSIFNQLSTLMRYQAITTWLIQFWGHSQYSLKGTFQPIGKIDDPNKLYLIDELEGIAANTLYYAVRAIRQGIIPSELQLLPFRVIVPDIMTPAAPVVSKIVKTPQGVKISWLPNYEPDIYAYEIYRYMEAEPSSTHRHRLPIQTLYIDPDTAPNGAQIAQRPPLQLQVVEQYTVVREQAIDLIFAAELWGVTSINDIVALYLRRRDIPQNYVDLSSEDFSEDEANYWTKLTNRSFSQDHLRIEGITWKDEANTEMFTDGTRVWLIVKAEQENQLLTLVFHLLQVEGVPLERLEDVNTIYVVGASRSDNLMPTTPDRIIWSQANGKRQRSLRLKLEPAAQASVPSNGTAVRVAYGPTDDALDQGIPYYEFEDTATEATKPAHYQVVAVRRVKTGVDSQAWTLIRST